MGSLSRRKGADAERDAAHDWQAAGFHSARRRCSGEECQHGQGRDLDGTGRFVVQVKHDQAATVHRALSEARAAARDGEIPVAWFRKNRQPFVVALEVADFFDLIRRAGDLP